MIYPISKGRTLWHSGSLSSEEAEKIFKIGCQQMTLGAMRADTVFLEAEEEEEEWEEEFDEEWEEEEEEEF